MMENSAASFIYKLGAIACCLCCAQPSYAAIELHTSLTDFIRVAGPTDALITNELGVSRATEVTGEPTQNLELGNTLTFEAGNTQFDFSFQVTADVSPSQFVFEDDEGSGTPGNFINALSVGDIDGRNGANQSALENDNWSVALLYSAWVSALGIDVRDNNFQNGATSPSTMETLSVFSDTGANLATFNLSSLNLGTQASQFLGVVATNGERISRIAFNEDNGGDDIAIANFRFSTSVESTASSMQTPRRSAASALTLDNKLVIAGGSNSADGRGITSTEYLDLNTGEFIQTGDLNVGRENHALTLLANGNLLATGGNDSNFSPLSSAEIYDVVSGVWQLAPSMSAQRNTHTATRLYDGRVLVVGGGTYEIFDPTTNTWSAPKALSPARFRHAATLAQDGKVWVTGGGASPQSTSIYDPMSDTWTAGPNMNLERLSHIMVTLADGRIAVVGNVRQVNNTCTEQLEILDPTDLSPTWDDSFSNPVFDKCSTLGGLLSTGQLFAARIDPDNNQAELEVYDHHKDRWDVRLTGFSNNGVLSGSVTLPNGKLVLLDAGEPSIFNPNYDLVDQGNLIGNRNQVRAGIFTQNSVVVSGGGVAGSEIITISNLTANSCTTCPDTNFSQQPQLAEYGGSAPLQLGLIQGGGFDGSNGFSGNIYQFEPNSDPGSPAAQPVGQLKIPRSGHTTNVLHDGRVLFAGGLPQEANNTAELFDPRTGRTTFTQPLNFDRLDVQTSVVLADGRVMLNGTIGATPEIFDPQTNRWTVTAPMNEPRATAQLTQLTDGRIMAAGGGSDPNARKFVEIYDPESNTWTQVADLNINRLLFTLTSLPNGLVLAAGGLGAEAGSSTEIYDPVTGQWRLGARLPFGAQSHAAVHLGDHRVALIGGTQSGSGKIQVYRWNNAITPSDTLSITFPDDTFDSATINFMDIPQLLGAGRTRDFGANAPVIYVRRIDGGAHQALQPTIDQNWYTEGNTYRFNWDDFTPGQVWVNGIFNGTPFSPRLFTIPYAPVVDNDLCLPIKTSQGSVAVICL